MSEFIKKNRKFWSQFKIKNSGKKILIEEPGRAMILHKNAIFAMIINQAKGHAPSWICRNNPEEHQLLRSYFPNVEIITPKKKWPLMKLYAIIIAFFKFIKILLTKDILGFHYDKVKYGDIVYDTYLFENKVATIKKIDFKIFKIIAKCIFRHIKIKNILQNGNYAGVLVSHLIGISSGVMLRSALRYGYSGYLCASDHLVSVQCFKKLEEISYYHKPSQSDIRQTIDQLGSKLKKIFLKILKEEISSKGNRHSLYAFSKNNPYYTNRASFNRDYKLNPNKKNVFIMLHALNDHPHSHFRWMIFKDYYDWFIETLKFAKKNNKVNWIFKQHPSIKNYTTKDVNFNKLFTNCPNNIIYIDETKQIDTRSLVHCADLIVTCLGSAGFELPAMGAIPSLTAGDNPYSGLGFALEPKTKEEYFRILSKANKIKKLTPQARKQAQATYIYIKRVSMISNHACPHLSESEIKDKNVNQWQWYWDKVLDQYSTKRNTILKELNCYIKAIRKPGFKKLISKI